MISSRVWKMFCAPPLHMCSPSKSRSCGKSGRRDSAFDYYSKLYRCVLHIIPTNCSRKTLSARSILYRLLWYVVFGCTIYHQSPINVWTSRTKSVELGRTAVHKIRCVFDIRIPSNFLVWKGWCDIPTFSPHHNIFDVLLYNVPIRV